MKGKNMTQIIEVIFDGKVLKPCTPIHLKKTSITRFRYTFNLLQLELYEVDIEVEDKKTSGNAWDILDTMTGSIEGPEDWAKEHDHYLYGTQKNK